MDKATSITPVQQKLGSRFFLRKKLIVRFPCNVPSFKVTDLRSGAQFETFLIGSDDA